MKISISLIKFLFLGALFIISNEQLHLGIGSERTMFFSDFYNWLETLFRHFGQITGYVVDSEWLPQENSTGPLEGIG